MYLASLIGAMLMAATNRIRTIRNTAQSADAGSMIRECGP